MGKSVLDNNRAHRPHEVGTRGIIVRNICELRRQGLVQRVCSPHALVYCAIHSLMSSANRCAKTNKSIAKTR